MSPHKPRIRRKNGTSAARQWSRLGDAALLKTRLCDLELELETSPLAARFARLHRELERAGLRFRPRSWISSEWFTPDGVPGFAVPFYVCHPRLARLERAQVFEVEGGSVASCMQLLRHETGHALDNAHRLHRRKLWREQFGRFAAPYPKFYGVDPHSRAHVQHIGAHYAQAHPAEDWAESFAVWLAPDSRWSERYAGWPVLEKLEAVDSLVRSVAESAPAVRSRECTDTIRSDRRTLDEVYVAKRARLSARRPFLAGPEIRQLFAEPRRLERRESAWSFLARVRGGLRGRVARFSGAPAYTVDCALGDLIERCRTLELVCPRSESQLLLDVTSFVTVQTVNFLHAGNHLLAH